MEPRLPHRAILDLLREAYVPCQYFGTCAQAVYDPKKGLVPRGYLGATASLNDVEAVIVLAEPGYPHPNESHDGEDPDAIIRSTIRYTYKCYNEGKDDIHKNVRWFADRLFPEYESNFEKQLDKLWITESRLCSLDEDKETKNISKVERLRCTEYHALRQIQLFPNAQIILAGVSKAQKAAHLFPGAIRCWAFARPGSNRKEARPSWNEAAVKFQTGRS